MDTKSLERRCIKLYGNINGRLLFAAMIAVHNKDFCVATGWNNHEMSVSRSCDAPGKIFKISEDYKQIIMPNGETKRIIDLTYSDIEGFLPTKYGKGEQRHCELDSINN